MKFLEKKILNVFDIINDLRIHIIINFFLLCSWFLFSIKINALTSVKYSAVITLFVAFTYLLNRYTDYEYDKVTDYYFTKLPRLYYYISSIVLLNVGIFLFFYYKQDLHLSYGQIFFLIFLAIFFSTTYSFKTFFSLPFKNYIIVKNIYTVGSKIFFIIYGAILFSPLPVNKILILSVSVVCMNLISTILWDIRDIKSDLVGNVKTIPVVFGRNKTIVLCLIILLSSFLFVTLFRNPSHSFFIRYLLVLLFIISFTKITHPRYFHLMIYVHILLNFIFSNPELKILFKNLHIFLIK